MSANATAIRSRFLIGLLASFLCTGSLTAQQIIRKPDTLGIRTNVGRLRELSKVFAEKAGIQKLEVLEYARKNNIPVGTTDSKGKYTWIHHIEQGKPVYYSTRSNLKAGESIKTNKLYSGGGLGLDLTGLGMEVSLTRSRLGMWEPGAIRATHQEFGGRVTSRDASTFSVQDIKTDHATHVGGSMIASGVMAEARGMAFQAKLDAYDSENDLAEMTTAASEGMLVSNHSYGADLDLTGVKNGYYDDESKDLDAMSVNAPYYLPIYAVGNDRDEAGGKKYDLLTGGSNAKNTIQVGAVKILAAAGYTGPASVEISDFSSFGPTDDGRIKPDFVAPGVQIYSSYSASDATYSAIDGTSMASPISASSLFLLQQHHKNTKAGAYMTSASLKALAIQTADETGDNPGPDYRYGWGLLNMETAIKVLNNDANAHFFKEAVLANGGTYSKAVATAGGVPFKVTIAWADKEAEPITPPVLNNRTPRLVNDLDLRVLDKLTGLTISDLPWKLDPVNPDAAASKGDNVVDNVEQISVASMPAGTYLIQVKHKGTLAAAQSFSVVVSGLSSSSLPVRLVSFDASPAEKQVTLHWSVADAVGFSHFEIEKSGDARNWVKLGQQAYQSGVLSYDYNDADILEFAGNTRYYRLKMADLDGSFAYSRMIAVALERNGMNQFAYPNPFKDKITISLSGLGAIGSVAQVTDVKGRVVSQRKVNINAVSGHVTVDGLGALPGGVYVLILKTGSGERSIKVLKQ